MKLIFTIFAVLLIALASATDGGYKPSAFNPNQDQIDQLALDGLVSYLHKLNSGLQFQKVLECQTQIVAGKNYKLHVILKDIEGNPVEYQTTIYVVPWEHRSEVTSFKKIQQESLKMSNSQESKGGYKYFSIDNPPQDYVQYIEIAKKLIAQRLSELNFSPKFKVEKAGVQVVSGFNFKFFIITDDGHKFTATIYIQPWTQTYQLLSLDQMDPVQKLQMFGGYTDFDFYDPEVQTEQSIKIAKNLIENELQIRNLNINFKVIKAAKQVVNGINLKFLIETNQGQIYEVMVYEQVWNNIFKITEFKEIPKQMDEKDFNEI